MSAQGRMIERTVVIDTAITLPNRPTQRIEPGAYLIVLETSTDLTTGTPVAVSAVLRDLEGHDLLRLETSDLDLFILSEQVHLGRTG